MYEKFLEEVGIGGYYFCSGKQLPLYGRKSGRALSTGAGADGSSKWKIQYFGRKVFRSDRGGREI